MIYAVELWGLTDWIIGWGDEITFIGCWEFILLVFVGAFALAYICWFGRLSGVLVVMSGLLGWPKLVWVLEITLLDWELIESKLLFKEDIVTFVLSGYLFIFIDGRRLSSFFGSN